MPIYAAPSPASEPRRVLVCGGRDFANRTWLYTVLDNHHEADPFLCIIQGAARGADSLAALWAKDRCVPLVTFFADWNKHGKAAGAIRNQQMLDLGKPTFVIGFPGGRGTADMIRRAEAAGIDWMKVSRSASVDRSPEGGDTPCPGCGGIGMFHNHPCPDLKAGLHAEHESAVANGETPTPGPAIDQDGGEG